MSDAGMDAKDEVLDALWAAAITGDTQAAAFLNMFAPWVLRQPVRPTEELQTVQIKTG